MDEKQLEEAIDSCGCRGYWECPSCKAQLNAAEDCKDCKIEGPLTMVMAISVCLL